MPSHPDSERQAQSYRGISTKSTDSGASQGVTITRQFSGAEPSALGLGERTVLATNNLLKRLSFKTVPSMTRPS
ncbi:hypothetical protein LPU83_pLPU83b_0031 (plasmid) [Rhizobium favelukesii]|uniref:Uncharacterized protein n=1 Tax=Rhizobium favelukesii TaxID=348824 RepID=W6S0M3_9HYPH|nr:hypothetical protein LPU83_pLPU83b_0031 [Rhizobium favelukesii]